MNNTYKKSILALTAALSVLISASPLNASAEKAPQPADVYTCWAAGSVVPKDFRNTCVNTITKDFGIKKCNFDGNDTFADADDFAVLEEKINALYAEEGYSETTKKKVTEENGFAKYDINGDGFATPEDYCILLQYVQRNFDFSIDYGESYAWINGYSGSDTKHLVVPSEVFAMGRIFPVMQIGNCAFLDHDELESITFRNYKQPEWRIADGSANIPTAGRVTASTFLHFGEAVFHGCSNLKELKLPQHVGFEDEYIFWGAEHMEDSIQEIDGIRYLCNPENDAFIAFDLTDEKKAEVEASHTLVFSDKTTSISKSLTKKLDPESIYNVELPRMLNFIEDSAFQNFTNLKTVCGISFDEMDGGRKMLIRQYLSAFDNTQFIADAVQARLDDIVEDITVTMNCNPETEQDKAILLAGRKIAELADYSAYDSLGTRDGKEASATNLQYFTDGFSLYPNCTYHYNDLSRNTTYSGSSVYLLNDGYNIAYTDCVGFAVASSLLLDQLGIQNYFCGFPGHAFNTIHIGDQWYVFDMAGNSLKDPADLRISDLKWGFYSDMYISNNRQFELFEHSKDKQLLAVNLVNSVLNPAGSTPELLNVQFSEKLTDDEESKMRFGNVFYVVKQAKFGWNNYDGGWQRYMGEDGRFLRNAPAPDGEGRMDENGWRV